MRSNIDRIYVWTEDEELFLHDIVDSSLSNEGLLVCQVKFSRLMLNLHVIYLSIHFFSL